MKPQFLRFVCLATAALLLAACKIQIGTSVNADGSGELQSEIGFTAEEIETLGQLSGGDADDFCATLQSQAEDLPPDTTFTQEQRGDETYCIATQTFASLDELRSLYDDMNVTVNALAIENGRFLYDVDADFSDAEGAGIFSLSFEWRLTVPGSVGENNADEVEGNTLVWKLTPGEKVNLRAESPLGLFNFGSSTIWIVAGLLLCCLCLLVIAGGAGAFFLLRRRKPVSSPDAPTMA